MRAMEELLTTGYPADGEHRFYVDPTIPSNITSWALCRQMLLNFGFTYYLRIRLYASYFVLVIGFIVIGMYIQLLTSSTLDITTIIMLIYQIFLLTILVFWMVSKSLRKFNMFLDYVRQSSEHYF
jgi:hypothetical protein